MFKQLAMVAFAATLSFSTAHAAVVSTVIDDYQDNTIGLGSFGSETLLDSSFAGSVSSITGQVMNFSDFADTRDIELTRTNGSDFDASTKIDNQTLIMNAGVGVKNTTVVSYYNAAGFDFLSAGTPPGFTPTFEGFILELLSIDNQGGMDIKLELTDTNGQISFEEQAINSPDSVLFESSAFTIGNPSLNMGSISQLVLTFSGGLGTDTSVDFSGYGYIPEPAPLALLGIGLVGIIFSRRRKVL